MCISPIASSISTNKFCFTTFLVDKVKDELQKVIDLLESGETDTEVIQETLDEAVCGINDLQEEVDEKDVYKRQPCPAYGN